MALFAEAVEAKLWPGDVFPPGWDDDRPEPFGPIIVLSHECEIDKSPGTILVVGLEVEERDRGLLGNIRSGRVWHALDLEGCSIQAWMNLRKIKTVPTQLLLDRLDRRVNSMTAEGRRALAAKVFQWLTRTLPPPPLFGTLR